jgi:lipoprotein-releasing system ATP-binding protein
MNNASVLSCEKLTMRYDQGGLNVEVLKGVNLQVYSGECVAIMGASGSGKSTLLHLLGGLEKPTGGKVVLNGVTINDINSAALAKLRNRSLGFIYQFHHLLGEFTVLENVAMPLLIGGQSVAVARQNTIGILERVGLGHRIEHKPGELSGGERQRAAVARALINKPNVILADEPTGNLDSRTAEQVFQLMLELNKELNVSFLIVTHDHDLASKMGKVMHMEDGVIV